MKSFFFVLSLLFSLIWLEIWYVQQAYFLDRSRVQSKTGYTSRDTQSQGDGSLQNSQEKHPDTLRGIFSTEDLEKDKFILDACCGGRMFWENKKHPNAIFQDIRKEVLPLKKQYGGNFSVEPDVIGDFRDMKFQDKAFKMVIFDPPHLFMNKTAWMAKKYGTLKGTDYKDDIKKGFAECWRVLDDFGTLIFKWNDNSISVKEIRPLFPDKPIIFNKIGTKGKTTWWFVFLKIPEKKRLGISK